MKVFVIWFAVCLYLSAQTHTTVNKVDKIRFSGLWYEIARTYNDFEKECVAATVEYVLEDEGYRVYNRCFEHTVGGELIEYEGTAEAIDGDSVHVMELTYFWIFSRDYRVVYINPDYTTAIVCDDTYKQVWIMHRRPEISQNELAAVLDTLAKNIDLNRLIFTPQDPQGRYQ